MLVVKNYNSSKRLCIKNSIRTKNMFFWTNYPRLRKFVLCKILEKQKLYHFLLFFFVPVALTLVLQLLLLRLVVLWSFVLVAKSIFGAVISKGVRLRSIAHTGKPCAVILAEASSVGHYLKQWMNAELSNLQFRISIFLSNKSITHLIVV